MAKKKLTEIQVMQKVLDALETLPKEDLPRVLNWLTNKLGLSTRSISDTQNVSPSTDLKSSNDQTPSVKIFLSQKKPSTDTERVACLAYYLTKHMNTPSFKTSDISSLNKDAARRPFSNSTGTVNDATNKYEFLAPVGGGLKQITVRGEAVVEALPDREKVKVALDEHLTRGRRKKGKKTRRKTNSK